MRFGEFLIAREVVDFSDVLSALLLQHERQASIAHVALKHDFMTVNQVARVLGIEADFWATKTETGLSRLFVEYAVELGFLNPEQAERLLILQISSRPPIGSLLVELGAIPADDLLPLLDDFYQARVEPIQDFPDPEQSSPLALSDESPNIVPS